MVKEEIIEEVVKIIGMYFNNQDWQGYMESLKNKEEVNSGILEVLEGVSQHKKNK